MAHISSLGYLVLGVSDLDAWAEFSTNILGMQIGQRTEDLLTLRMDQHTHRFMLERDPSDDIKAAGWQLDSEPALEEYVAQLKARGVAVKQADEALRAHRQVARLYVCADPNGYQHEFFTGPAQANGTDHFRSQVLRGAFKTGSLGIGHFVVIAKNLEETLAFYRDVLGLQLSGYMDPPGFFKVAFLHALNGRYHTLAVAQAPIPKKLMHLAVEVEQLDDVGCALDRAMAAGVPIAATLGHHPNALSTSFYMQGPSGFEVEILSGELVVDDADWQIKTYREFSDWGHKRGDVS